MQSSTTMVDAATQTIAPWRSRFVPVAYSLGIISLSLALVLGIIEGDGYRAVSFSYVYHFAFFLGISLASLLFVSIQHITRAGWSTVIRRIAEITSLSIVPYAVLFLPILIPVLFGISPLYEWNHADVVKGDRLLENKAPYLNAGFFAVRWVIYFAVWGFIAWRYFQWSRTQDKDGSPVWSDVMEQWAGPSAIALSLTLTFAAIDMLMSLDAHWFSTIFGVYYFAGSMVCFLACMVLAINLFRQMGLLNDIITTEHIHDVGKLLFGFNCFWAYIAFSQYLLIWYSNIPEETEWYLKRQTDGWGIVSLILIFGHFGIPFLGMMSRDVKRNLGSLSFWAVWMLVMNYLDLFWLTIPEFSNQGPTWGLLDIACFFGCGSIFLANWAWVAGSTPLVPSRDPRLPESLAFHNI